MSARSRVVAPLLAPTLVVALVVALVAALAVGLSPASAEPEQEQVVPQPAPPTCDLDCPPDPTYVHEATLSVTRTAGWVTSNTHNGHAIDCGVTCSVTDTQETLDPDFPSMGWFTYTLGATGGPAGYSPRWTGCDNGTVTGGTCAVTNDDASGTSVTMTWVDTTAPGVTFNPPAKVGSASSFVSAGATDNSGAIHSYEWRVDSVLQATTGFALSLAAVAEGSHSVAVRARDGAGNWSATVTRSITVDRSVALVAEPVAEYVSSPPTLTFTTDSDVVSRKCSVAPDGGDHTPQDCTSPWSTGQLVDGSYEAVVTVTDDVGNTATVQRDFTLDSVGPDLAFTAGPAEGATQSAAGAVFSFTATDPALDTVACTLDGTAVPCEPGTDVELTKLAPGVHTFAVTATDLAGNESVLSRSFVRKVSTSLTAKAKSRKVHKGKRAVLLAKGLPAAATGKVVFKRGSKVLCTATVKDGKGQCRTGKLHKKGTYAAKATYKGALGYARSTDTFSFKVVR